MRLSLHSVHGGVKNIDKIHQRARRAEELGYSGIFIGESHLSSIDSFQTLATCAMLTKRMLLAIAVTSGLACVPRRSTSQRKAPRACRSAGTPEECIERIEELRDAGVEHLMLTPARKVYHESVETFAAKVIPHFRN